MAEFPVPIAVVGIGCRFPGGANNPEKLWRMLSEGRNAWSDVPEHRFNWKAFHHPDAETQGAFSHRGAHFLDQDITAFDAGFFGISPLESEAVDPQHRVQLEVAYEALENAGIPVETIQGSDTAVYVAVFSQDYAAMQYKDIDDIPKYHMTGTGNAIASNRISYIFDLKGPSVTLDTGCSGSLVAIHQACQSLRSGECGIALAGGANLILNPDMMIPMSLLHILNNDGRCYSFDSRGSGYGRGEGAAMVVLKRFDDAIRAGDHIRAVIRNTGVGQDGKTPGITVPNRVAQQSLISSVYQRAGLDPRDTGYIEAHGTGTTVGDVEELAAIQAAFDSHDRQAARLYVGSIKPNIGHLESASGIAGLIKAILMLEHGMILPNVNLQRLKEDLNLETTRIIPRRLKPWADSALRRVSVNSFGYGGTNAHAILEAATIHKQVGHDGSVSTSLYGYGVLRGAGATSASGFTNSTSVEWASTNGASHNHAERYPNDPPQHTQDHIKPPNAVAAPTNSFVLESISELEQTNRTLQVLALSAKSAKSLRKALDNLREWISAHLSCKDDVLLDLAHTLVSRRSIMQWRCSFTATSLQNILSSLESGNLKPVRSSSHNQTIYIFTGQGAQWFAMGRELIRTQSKYTESLQRSNQILAELGASWNLIDELEKDELNSRLNESEIGQPATTAVQLALIDLLYSVGVRPDAVLGHSSGEIAAAYAAGALTQSSALKVAYYRGLLVTMISAKGAMLAVGLGEKDVLVYISQLKAGVAVVACANSPSSSTIAGDEAAIIELKETLDAASIFARRLKVDMAYHSHHIKAIANNYLRYLGGLESGAPVASVKFISSVTAREMTSGFGPEYWVQNLLSKVRFYDALEYLCRKQDGTAQPILLSPKGIFVEIGPHNALSGPIRQTMTHLSSPSGFSCFSTLIRNKDAVSTVLELAGNMFEQGCQINLGSVNALVRPDQTRSVLQNLPPYPWDHSNSYWHESRLSKAHRFRMHPYHDLLGVRVVSSTSLQPLWRHIMSVNRLPWVREHVIDDFMVFPGSGYICMAIEATNQLALERQEYRIASKYVLRNVTFSSALIIPESPQYVEVQLSLTPTANSHEKAGSEWEEFRVFSISAEGTSVEHCRGAITVEFVSVVDEVEATRERDLWNAAQKAQLEKIRASCYENIDCTALYSDLKSRGNFYGPNFASVRKLSLGGGSAVSTVQVPNIAKDMPAHFIQPHVIHPATLDALMHAPIPLFNRQSGARCVMAVGIGELTISANIANTPGTSFVVATTLTGKDSTTSATEISVFQTSADHEHELVVHIYDGELRSTGNAESNALEVNTTRDMSYQMKWDLDADHITSSLFKLLEADDVDEDLLQEQKLYLLNQAAALYIRACIDEISASGTLSLLGHYNHLFNWMKRFQLSEESRKLTLNVPQSETHSILRKAQELGVEGEILCRVGRDLASILTEKADPLALMLEDDLLYRLYADDASVRCYSHMVKYLKYLVFKDPNMTVLELGAGTGGATAPLLQSLGQNGVLPLQRYDFTDVSAGFFERSRSRLQEWGNYLQYKTLDIQKDPFEQGFTKESYDLIIASNVLHVASYIDAAVSRIRKLLKPGGRLIMIETIRVVPFYNTCIGVLPGWWAGVEDNRTDAPILTVEQWNTTLLRNGFSGIEIVAKDYEGSAQRSAMLVSKAAAYEDNMRSKSDIPVKIIRSPSWTTHHPDIITRLSSILSENDILSSVGTLSDNIELEILYVILDDSANPILTTSSSALFERTTNLLVKATRVLWISVQGDFPAGINMEKALITGVARVARAENESLTMVTVDIQDKIDDNCDAVVKKIKDLIITRFYGPAGLQSSEVEYVYKNGQFHIPRILPDPKINQRVQQTANQPRLEPQLFHQPHRPLKLRVEKPGFLDSLQFVDDESLKEPLSALDIEVHVDACGLNFKDVLIALGQLKKPIPMAGEYAGRVIKVGTQLQQKFRVGDRVCGFGATAYASHVRVNGQTACKLPDSMSYAMGASIPVVFSTAYHALVDVAGLRKGQTVLIHSAAGGVGQAALRISQHIGAEIFATAGSASKRNLLIDQFSIPEDHIFSSKIRTFKQGIYRLTNGKGVDVVLNSLSGQALQDSWACIARFGVFIELGKVDAISKGLLSMEPFERSVTFTSVDLTMMYEHRPEKTGQLLTKVLSMFEAGHYIPIRPVIAMAMTEIQDAFRLMQARKHSGKIVLEAKSDTIVLAPPKTSDYLRLPEDATYLIAGGLGGLGLQIARFLVDHGAKHVVLLSRRNLDPNKRQQLEEKFRILGAEVRVLTCDITDLPMVQGAVLSCVHDMPPIRGLIQAAMVLQDRVLAQMDLKDFQTVTQPKVIGTQNLIKALESQPLDFFFMLSSGASIIGNLSQANYAAGNAFMDVLANTNTIRGTHFVALNLGPISDAGTLATSARVKQILVRQGYILLKLKELLAVVEYSISKEAKSDQCKQIIIGFDCRSFAESDNKYSLQNPMFCHLLRSKESQRVKDDSIAVRSIEGAIAVAENIEQVETVISEAIARKISTLVAVDYEEVDLRRRVGEFGLDSLVLIELKNWIKQNFHAKLQPSEISDAPQIIALAGTVATRSALVAKDLLLKRVQSSSKKIASQSTQQEEADLHSNEGAVPFVLPKQPLPDLDSSLDHYLDAVRPIFTDEEYTKTLGYVEEFRKPSGFGRELQDRLSRLANDPNVDNWQRELYDNNVHLKGRVPLVPWCNFFGTHLKSPFPHSPAERAAIISTAAFQFKQKLEDGGIGYEFLNEQAMSKNLYEWFFNATREPRAGKDETVKYPGNDYLVAFRHGHVFKIVLRDGNGPTPFHALKAAFQKILNSEKKLASWVGVLTADSRDSWAEIRQILRDVSTENNAWVHIIEAAAFAIYLDDAQPQNASERGHQFLHANGFNRWNDKTVQFSICDNGVSAAIGEHSMLDGLVFRRLNDFITQAIMDLKPESATNSNTQPLPDVMPLGGYSFTTTPIIDQHIERVRAQILADTSRYEFAAFEITTIGSDFFGSHKCPSKSGVQLVVQLACRRHFGYNPTTFETVSLNHFLRGRVDLNYVVWQAVAKFCAAASDPAPLMKDLRILFLEAAKVHASNVMRASRGHGIGRYFSCLEWSVRDGEEVPGLFADPLYETKFKPQKVITDCLMTRALECGSLLPDPESLWIHFEPDQKGCVLFFKLLRKTLR
ncbi:hypothetical protein AOQ84DRAFT_416453 [Glonium stellatum]|uniref:Carrier domain-containing protein n=1 Tax=Glonium stellatum TaxID=574774 RepID=A0A8E2ET03_9PEZI|nr:hypothetical protein AOQ84DRAFT_416453 [Glonium stellatum]